MAAFGFSLAMMSEYLPCGTKQMSWLSALAATGQPHALGDGADLGLGHAAEREAQIVDLLLRGGEQEVALVAVGVDRPEQRAVRAVGAAADVVAGGQRIGAELARGLQKVGELDGLVAGHARDRRLAGDIALGERVDHRLAEPLLVVEHVMRNAERLGRRAAHRRYPGRRSTSRCGASPRHGRRAAA